MNYNCFTHRNKDTQANDLYYSTDNMLTSLFHYLELSPQFKLRKPDFSLGLFVEVSRVWCSMHSVLVFSGNLMSGHWPRLSLDYVGQGWLWATDTRKVLTNLLPHSNPAFIYIVNFGTQEISWPLCYILLPTRCLVFETHGAQTWSNKCTEGQAHIRRISNQNLTATDHVTCFGKWKGRQPQLLPAYQTKHPGPCATLDDFLIQNKWKSKGK